MYHGIPSKWRRRNGSQSIAMDVYPQNDLPVFIVLTGYQVVHGKCCERRCRTKAKM